MYPSSSPFHLPSPHYLTLDDGTIFDELLQQQQQHLFFSNPSGSNIADHEQLITNHDENMGKCSNNNGDNIGLHKPESCSKKKRSASKKIETAQGPRDRRMRLSVDVGRKFFKLQDMLGFDKASKTVEWLLMKSRSKIQELMICRESDSTSRCELLCEDHVEDNENARSSCNSNRKGKKKSSRREVRKSSYNPPCKETREMARKRARERTLEKSCKLQAGCVNGGGDKIINSKFTPCLDQAMDQQDQVNHLGSWIINQAEPPIIDDNSSSMVAGLNPSFVFDYQQTGALFDLEHQFNDFEILRNIWEAKS